MKKLVLSLMSAMLFSVCLNAQGTVNPKHETVHTYVKHDGTVVPQHERTAPNNTQKDNASTKGNTNPWTGKAGTKTAKK